jgi:alcohol dehydrogenase class IV
LGGKKALLVTDKGLRAIKDGAVDKTLEHLREAGIDVVVFDGVEPNPKTPTCATVWTSFAKSIAISSLPSAAVA